MTVDTTDSPGYMARNAENNRRYDQLLPYVNPGGPEPFLTWVPIDVTAGTATYTPGYREWLARSKPICVPASESLEFRRIRAERQCCDYCGCLLPDEYRPNCSQCGGPVRAREERRKSPKWERKPLEGFRFVVDNPEYLKDYLDHMSRTSKGG